MGLEDWGWDERWLEAMSALGIADGIAARVTAQHRGLYQVQTDGAAMSAASRKIEDVETVHPAVGDWVVLEGPVPGEPAIIEAVLPRRTGFSRQAAGNRTSEQVLAANIDVVWIVHGLDNRLRARKLERFLTMAWQSGAAPVIVLTKTDLVHDVEEELALVEEIALGVDVRAVSVVADGGADGLARDLVPAQTVALLGSSGVGKSSLVNHLSGNELLATGEVREQDRRGRHTTTHRELIRLESGALLLDTPGMRELRVWDVDEGLTQAFPEIENLAEECRYRDCSHSGEPDCAVRAAVESGAIPADRLESYLKLQDEAAFHARRLDVRARLDQKQKQKTIAKSLKRHPKYRDRE